MIAMVRNDARGAVYGLGGGHCGMVAQPSSMQRRAGLCLAGELLRVGAEPDSGQVSHPRAGTFLESPGGGNEGGEPVVAGSW